MKALTVRQPWANLIMGGAKMFEFRTWSPPQVPYLPIAIHAAATVDDSDEADQEADWRQISRGPTGAILGIVQVYEGVRLGDLSEITDTAQVAALLAEPGCPPTYHWDRFWAWRLGDVVCLTRPVPCKGRQGLWEVPEDVERQVREQL